MLRGMGQLIGYARVSTPEQDASLQEIALERAGCLRVFVDVSSGAVEGRPQLDAAMDHLRPGDSLVVWRLDRLGRSLKHLIDTVSDLQQREVGFVSLTESMDTSTSAGKLLFHLFGALAEFERDLIRERTRAGLAVARARGRSGGRPPVLSELQVETLRKMYDSKQYTIAELARTFGCGRATIYRILRPTPAAPPAPAVAPLEDRKAQLARDLHADGCSVSTIASTLRMSAGRVRRALEQPVVGAVVDQAVDVEPRDHPVRQRGQQVRTGQRPCRGGVELAGEVMHEHEAAAGTGPGRPRLAGQERLGLGEQLDELLRSLRHGGASCRCRWRAARRPAR